MKLSQIDVENKSKLVLARKFELFGGEPIIQLAILGKNGNVRFIGDKKIYNLGNCKVLTKGIPTGWLKIILFFLRKESEK